LQFLPRPSCGLLGLFFHPAFQRTGQSKREEKKSPARRVYASLRVAAGIGLSRFLQSDFF
jgi:hypothetical protein